MPEEPKTAEQALEAVGHIIAHSGGRLDDLADILGDYVIQSSAQLASITARLERANLVLRIVAASYFDDNGEVTISEIPLSTRKEASAIIGGK